MTATAAGPGSAAAAGLLGALSIVVVIAQYPPHHRGGYELRCRDICREMVKRGHRVTVLTSREGARGVEDDHGVRVVRALHLWPDGVLGTSAVLHFVRTSASDCRKLRRELRRTRADALAFWHQSGLTSALLAVQPPRGCGILCDVSSDWLVDAATTGGNWFRIWEKSSTTWWKALGKSAVRAIAGVLGAPVTRPPFPPGRAYFTSADRKRRNIEAGVHVESAALIRSGIDLESFRFLKDRSAPSTRTVLFIVRIKRRKGLHTAVLALGYLPADVHLRVVGAVEDEGYAAEVGDLIRKTGLGARVRLGSPVSHDEIADLLRDAHVLAFCSEEPEAFSRLVLESFACGTPVVGTTIGGTGEVLIEGETGLTYPPGNARALADQLRRMFDDAPLRERLVANARELVESKYAIGFTVQQIEALLREARTRASSAQ
ncbi:MAG: glycosyltransferase family 4 protein [Planctomycetes bacterium]|nr:glycosyltransferase family 4 protein [Planctomycetota bacterium]